MKKILIILVLLSPSLAWADCDYFRMTQAEYARCLTAQLEREDEQRKLLEKLEQIRKEQELQRQEWEDYNDRIEHQAEQRRRFMVDTDTDYSY